MLLLDGNKTCRYYPYIEAAEEMWGRLLNVDPKGLVHYCDRDPDGSRQVNGIILRSDDPYYEDKIATVVRQAMYMAKVHTKGFTTMDSEILARPDQQHLSAQKKSSGTTSFFFDRAPIMDAVAQWGTLVVGGYD